MVVEFENSLKQIMDERSRERMRAAANVAFPSNGAVEAAGIIERLARGEEVSRGRMSQSRLWERSSGGGMSDEISTIPGT